MIGRMLEANPTLTGLGLLCLLAVLALLLRYRARHVRRGVFRRDEAGFLRHPSWAEIERAGREPTAADGGDDDGAKDPDPESAMRRGRLQMFLAMVAILAFTMVAIIGTLRSGES